MYADPLLIKLDWNYFYNICDAHTKPNDIHMENI